MPWCPDPACRAEIPDRLWATEEFGSRAHETEMYAWTADCPACARRLSVHQSVEHDTVAVAPDPEGWCCPLCGHVAELRAMNRGPLGAYLRCAPGGCEARISMSRRPMAELLRRPGG